MRMHGETTCLKVIPWAFHQSGVTRVAQTAVNLLSSGAAHVYTCLQCIHRTEEQDRK